MKQIVDSLDAHFSCLSRMRLYIFPAVVSVLSLAASGTAMVHAAQQVCGHGGIAKTSEGCGRCHARESCALSTACAWSEQMRALKAIRASRGGCGMRAAAAGTP